MSNDQYTSFVFYKNRITVSKAIHDHKHSYLVFNGYINPLHVSTLILGHHQVVQYLNTN
jgi:hypothetical protein